MSKDLQLSAALKEPVAEEPAAQEPVAEEPAAQEPVAIVGLGCRFPGAPNVGAFRSLLRSGGDAVVEVPADRWGPEVYDPTGAAPGTTNSRWGGFLPQIDGFDASFFGISHREAQAMDPQQRLLLEVAWEALEDAGQEPGRHRRSTGVFVGSMYYEYGHLSMADRPNVGALTGPGISQAITSNRISYHLNLDGPSLTLDTACSSSLVAIHLACQSLRRGECETALAGGVSLMLTPTGHIFFTKAGIMSPDGRCRTFDAGANGIVRGEGAGMVVLKLLSQARRDGDFVYGVVAGGAMNHNGHGSGLISPSRSGQEALLRRAYDDAGVSARDIQYVELHGTATLLGDLMEATALGTVMAEARGGPEAQGNGETVCAVGSVKTNLGHLESAAGVAGLIKVALMLESRELWPNLHFETPSPHIPFDELPLQVVTECGQWPSSSSKEATAGISSFGFGGTNVHLVVRSAPLSHESLENPREIQPETAPYNVLSLSAGSPAALKKSAEQLASWWSDESRQGLGVVEVAATQSAGKTQFPYRWAKVFAHDDRDGALARLRELAQAEDAGEVLGDGEPKLLFVFDGQGPQRPGMGAEWMGAPIFRQTLVDCNRIFMDLGVPSILPFFEAPSESAGDQNIETELERTDRAQPALFALQVATAALWRSWGVRPWAVVGHSLGEVAAAYVAGVLELPDAARVVFHRSRLMEGTAGQGAMAVVGVDAARARRLVRPKRRLLSLAAINSASSVVLSGDEKTLNELCSKLQDDDVSVRPMDSRYPFHGPQMVSLESELVAALDGLRPRPAKIPLWSTLTGLRCDGDEMGAAHWGRQMCRPVLFLDALKGALSHGDGDDKASAVLEIGPDPVLAAYIRPVAKDAAVDTVNDPVRKISVLATLRRGRERRVSLESLARLYELGATIRWKNVQGNSSFGPRLYPPSYPWQHKRYWLGGSLTRTSDWPVGSSISSSSSRSSSTEPPRDLLDGHRPLTRPVGAHLWDFPLDPDFESLVQDHKIQDAVVMPGAAYVELMASAFSRLCAGTSSSATPGDESGQIFELKDLRLNRAMYLEADSARPRLQVSAFPGDFSGTGDIGGYDIEVSSYRPGAVSDGDMSAQPVLHSGGRWRLHKPTNEDLETTWPMIEARFLGSDSTSERLSVSDHYERLWSCGFGYGPAFQVVRDLWTGSREALASLEDPDLWSRHHFTVHPGLLDASLHVLMAAIPEDSWVAFEGRAMMPTGVGEIRIHGLLTDSDGDISAHAVLKRCDINGDTAGLSGDVTFFRQDGRVLVQVFEVRAQRLEQKQTFSQTSQWDFCFEPLSQPWQETLPELSADTPSLSSASIWWIAGEAENAGRLEEALNRLGYETELRSDAPDEAPVDDDGIPKDLPDQVVWVAPLLGDGKDGDAISKLVTWIADLSKWIRTLDDMEKACRLWLVTRGVQGGDALGDGGAMASTFQGLSRALAAEKPDLWGGWIDLDGEMSEGAELLARLASDSSRSDRELMLWDGAVHVRRWRPLELPPEEQSTDFEAETVLITGGLGGLGWAVAEDFARRQDGVQRHLVLLSRRTLGSEEQAAKEAELLSGRSEELPKCSLQIACADVADEEALVRLVETLKGEGRPPIRTVIHSAGVAREEAVDRLGPEILELHFQAKIKGAWALHRATLDEPISNFVLFSSSSAVLPEHGRGLGAYAAANGFLDGFAEYRRSLALPALSIAWGPWNEVGMAADKVGLMSELGIQSLSPAQGLDVLRRLMDRPKATSRVAVIPGARSQGLPLVGGLSKSAESAVKKSTRTAEAHRPAAKVRGGSTGGDLSGDLKSQVLSLVAPRLVRPDETEQPNLNLPLVDQGMDSLAAAEIKNAVDARWSVSVPITGLLRGWTPQDLMSWLEEQMPPEPVVGAAAQDSVVDTPSENHESIETQAEHDSEQVSESKKASFVDNGSESTRGSESEDAGADENVRATESVRIAEDIADRVLVRPWLNRQVQKVFRTFIRCTTSVEVEGAENLPTRGPLILAYNHLSKWDKVGLIAYPSIRCTLIVAGFGRYRPWLRAFLDRMVDSIFVDRGAADLEAIDQALKVLGRKGAISMSPEGEISDTGGLMEAKNGIALLATRTGATVVPVAAWGHEKARQYWRRGKRVPVQLRVGQPIRLPHGESTGAELRRYTEQVMLDIARLLPPEHRGVYSYVDSSTEQIKNKALTEELDDSAGEKS